MIFFISQNDIFEICRCRRYTLGRYSLSSIQHIVYGSYHSCCKQRSTVTMASAAVPTGNASSASRNRIYTLSSLVTDASISTIWGILSVAVVRSFLFRIFRSARSILCCSAHCFGNSGWFVSTPACDTHSAPVLRFPCLLPPLSGKTPLQFFKFGEYYPRSFLFCYGGYLLSTYTVFFGLSTLLSKAGCNFLRRLQPTLFIPHRLNQ